MSVASVKPLGDSAILVTCASEAFAQSLADTLWQRRPAWLVDTVTAYATVGVFYDVLTTDMKAVEVEILSCSASCARAKAVVGRLHVIPCCYEMGPDLWRVAEHAGLTADAVVTLHAGREYTVYAVGFCPGFPYLGYLPAELSGVPRLPSPRTRVEPGSVGLTGRQTGLYPLPRPGGWNLVGRTPLTVVDVAAGFFPIRTGDRVRFEAIGAGEFRALQGRRLGE